MHLVIRIPEHAKQGRAKKTLTTRRSDCDFLFVQSVTLRDAFVWLPFLGKRARAKSNDARRDRRATAPDVPLCLPLPPLCMVSVDV